MACQIHSLGRLEVTGWGKTFLARSLSEGGELGLLERHFGEIVRRLTRRPLFTITDSGDEDVKEDPCPESGTREGEWGEMTISSSEEKLWCCIESDKNSSWMLPDA